MVGLWAERDPYENAPTRAPDQFCRVEGVVRMSRHGRLSVATMLGMSDLSSLAPAPAPKSGMFVWDRMSHNRLYVRLGPIAWAVAIYPWSTAADITIFGRDDKMAWVFDILHFKNVEPKRYDAYDGEPLGIG